MWVGNVPGNVKHDELWHFFSHDRGPGPGGEHENRNQNGVLSIFLISRSRCAFVNYETEDVLQAAIKHFDGMVMSAADPRAARLVCQVRKNGDDVQAGVGGQRGKGLHVEWVKKQAQAQSTATRVADRSNTEQPSSQSSNSSTPSAASTTSSFLETHFPQRFFILKSLTQANIDTSVSSGLWATQRHNEDVLNRAFCTAKDVFLIFSVNKSGGFCGCARMQGTIGNHGSGFIKWDMPAPKEPSPGVLVASPKPLHPNEVRASPFRAGDQVPRLLSAPVQTSLPLKHDAQTAPPHFGQLHYAISFEKPNRQYSLGQRNPVELPPRERTGRSLRTRQRRRAGAATSSCTGCPLSTSRLSARSTFTTCGTTTGR